MKSLLTAAFVIALAGAAQAMPVAPAPADGLTTLVAQGCGPGMARNPAGRCRPAYMARPCPPGFHRNAVGICRPNR
jgi:CDP-diacylglycerol pyrophosphatase